MNTTWILRSRVRSCLAHLLLSSGACLLRYIPGFHSMGNPSLSVSHCNWCCHFYYCISLSFSAWASYRAFWRCEYFGVWHYPGVFSFIVYCFLFRGRTLSVRKHGIHHIGLQGHVRSSFHIVLRGLYFLVCFFSGQVGLWRYYSSLRYLGAFSASSPKRMMDGCKVQTPIAFVLGNFTSLHSCYYFYLRFDTHIAAFPSFVHQVDGK
jgi:hypothetical protein